MPAVQVEAESNKQLLSELRNETDQGMQKVEDCRKKAKTESQEEK